MKIKNTVFWFIEILIWTLILLFTACYSYRKGYVDCAKDFYNGKVKVDLLEREDGVKEWIWIK